MSPAAPPLDYYLRVYLYQYADALNITRAQADALLAGELSVADAGLPPGPAAFVTDSLAQLAPAAGT